MRQVITRQPADLVVEMWKYLEETKIDQRQFVENAIRRELQARRGL